MQMHVGVCIYNITFELNIVVNCLLYFLHGKDYFKTSQPAVEQVYQVVKHTHTHALAHRDASEHSIYS